MIEAHDKRGVIVTELQAFCESVSLFGNLDAAGALADWLEEHDDPRGVLLRKRWKRWQKERKKAQEELEGIKQQFGAMLLELRKAVNAIPGMEYNLPTRIVEHYGIKNADSSFHAYVRERFKVELRVGRMARIAANEAENETKRKARATAS